MKLHQLGTFFACGLLGIITTNAAVRYVDVNSVTPTPPFTNWATAATNIQDAVDAAGASDQILVTNGVYQTGGKADSYGVTNRVTVDKSVALQSVNGSQFTVIDGSGTVRCVFLVNGTALSGFTLTNGLAQDSGGGVAFDGFLSDAIVSNCVIAGCSAKFGGAAGSSLFTGGQFPHGGTLINCTMSGNSATGPFNPPLNPAGGAVDNCRLISCLLSNNACNFDGGGASASTLQNCLLTGNSANGAGGGAVWSTLINCTVSQNIASFAGGVYFCDVQNSIVYYNSGPNHFSDLSITYSCTTPLPTNGDGNITNTPLFMDPANGNFRLALFSPCIDAGNNSYVTTSVDLDGNQRIMDGVVDMGAYEQISVPHYVSLDSPNPTPPYLTWSTAATNIQDAVDAANSLDQIFVTNGVYVTGGRNYSRVDMPSWSSRVSLRSVNGPQFTFILGGPLIRCVNLSARSSLSGFTLTNGSATYNGCPGCPTLRGGGVSCFRPYAFGVVSNCVLTGNSADEGGGAYGGTLINCTLANNSARYGGGGASGGGSASGGLHLGCLLINCTLTGNQSGDLDLGGGVFHCTLTNCMLANNSDPVFIGEGAMESDLYRCTLVGNGAAHCSIYNSTLTGSLGWGAVASWLQNCTLTANWIGANNSVLENCIVYDNLVSDYEGNSGLTFCCTRVMPTNSIGNLTNAPIFLDQFGGNLRLASNSPCINAGQNAYAAGLADSDGNPRVVGGTVDIGAFEFQSPSSVLSYAWAQQYGLPTDGSADYADSDNDLMNNWQEWIAGTVPTDATSALRLLSPSTSPSGAVVTWESVSNRTYFLERTTNIGGTPFSLVASNILGQIGTTSFTDTNATGAGPFFYRVGVQ